MALPAGALTATVTCGQSTNVAGIVGVISKLTVAPENRLVWAATGDAVETIPAKPNASTVTILADQSGVFASSTVDGKPVLVEVREWPLKARWNVTVGSDVRKHERRFAAPAAGTTIDLDMLPEDGACTPGTVTMAQSIVVDASVDNSTDMVADLSVGTVTTGAPGSDAAASLTPDGDAYVLDLTIPRGDAGVTDHNTLTNLQGGATGELYHLTAAQLAALTATISDAEILTALEGA